MLLIGAVLQAGVIAAAASFLANLDKHRFALRQRLDDVDAHLSHHKVDHQLQKKVRSFFEYLFHCGHHTNEDELLGGLSEKLRMQLLLARMRNIVEKAAVFRRLSSPCTLALVDLLVPVVVLPREYVLVQGMVGNEMFFVARGLVQVTIVIDKVEYALEQLGEGGAFGEGSLLRCGIQARRSMSVLTIRFCELLQLGRGDFDWLVHTFSEFQDCVQKLCAPHSVDTPLGTTPPEVTASLVACTGRYTERLDTISVQIQKVENESKPGSFRSHSHSTPSSMPRAEDRKRYTTRSVHPTPPTWCATSAPTSHERPPAPPVTSTNDVKRAGGDGASGRQGVVLAPSAPTTSAAVRGARLPTAPPLKLAPLDTNLAHPPSEQHRTLPSDSSVFSATESAPDAAGEDTAFKTPSPSAARGRGARTSRIASDVNSDDSASATPGNSTKGRRSSMVGSMKEGATFIKRKRKNSSTETHGDLIDSLAQSFNAPSCEYAPFRRGSGATSSETMRPAARGPPSSGQRAANHRSSSGELPTRAATT